MRKSLKSAASRRKQVVLSLSLALALAVSGCGGGDPDKGGASEGGAWVPLVSDYEPLTGLPTVDGERASTRPVVAVKVDNSERGRPQTGLADADVIIEVSENSLSRFIALYHSEIPDAVGPVSGAGVNDAGVLAMLNMPLFAHTGDDAQLTVEAAEAGVFTDLGQPEHPGLYWGDISRETGRNQFVSPVGMRIIGDASTGALRLFSYRSEIGGHPDTARPVRWVGINHDYGVTARFEWDDIQNGWLLWHGDDLHTTSRQTVADSEDIRLFAPANVVVLFTEHTPSGWALAAAEPSSGGALVLTDGHAISGRWSRASLGEPWVLEDTKNQEILLAPGQTFVVLAEGEAEFSSDVP